MPLNPGLTETEVNERIHRAICPMCGDRLQVLLRREWATCRCCGVDYAQTVNDQGVDWFACRYVPDGHPHCQHYRAAARPRGPRLQRFPHGQRPGR